ncbi:MAG: hypothetical protein ACRDIX_00050 [Actinomycetota bacterium]
MNDLDELIRDALSDHAGRARFDRNRWEPSVTRLPAPRRPRLHVRRPARRALAGLAVAAVLAAAIAGPLFLLSRLGTGTREGRPSGSTVEGYGIRLDLPDGWEGQVVGPLGTDFGPILTAANRPLVADDDFATQTRRRLAAGEVGLVLIDYTEVRARLGHDPGDGGEFLPAELPISVRPGDFQQSFEGVDPSHHFARRTFTVSGRSFDLWVDFGSRPAPEDVLGHVNEVLATLRIDALDSPPGYVTHSDIDDGLSIRIPAAWTFHQDPSGPAEPRTVFAVGSWPFPTGGECAPQVAQEELPNDGTLFWLIEYRDRQGVEFPDRPEFFELDPATLANYECSVVPSYLIRFRDAGRAFQVHVAFGPEASESLGPEVLRALESLEVTAPVPGGCPADTGPWSDPDCPWAAWTGEVVETAGYEVTGDTGSALIAEGAGAEFFIWTTEADPTDQYVVPPEPGFEEGIYLLYQNVADITVYTDGTRLLWTVQGFHVWVEENVDGPIPVRALEPLVRASLTVDYDAIDTRP